jgi:hypothetical protein
VYISITCSWAEVGCVLCGALYCVLCGVLFAVPAATTRICADGGANRLYDQIVEMLPGADSHMARSSFLPDLIKVRGMKGRGVKT